MKLAKQRYFKPGQKCWDILKSQGDSFPNTRLIRASCAIDPIINVHLCQYVDLVDILAAQMTKEIELQ